MADLDEEVYELAEILNQADQYLDCGDNSCLFAPKKGGMRTNGGCRCVDRPFVKPALAKVLKAARAIAAHAPNREEE